MIYVKYNCVNFRTKVNNAFDNKINAINFSKNPNIIVLFLGISYN
jgi:hypothetical protein